MTDRTEYDPNTEAIKHLTCPRCEALPGQGCQTISGRPCGAHTARTNPLHEAYAAGYFDAEDDAGSGCALVVEAPQQVEDCTLCAAPMRWSGSLNDWVCPVCDDAEQVEGDEGAGSDG